MDWFPFVFGTFKVVALAVGMYFAVKWHYDQGEKDQDAGKQKRAVLRAAAKAFAVFVVALLVLGLLTYLLATRLGLDLSLS